MPTKPRGPLRAAIYARQSVPKEDGILNQLDACRKLIDLREYVPAGEYIDDGVSGSKERGERTAWAKMIADARSGKFDVVVVRKLDRLTRALHSITELQDAHVLVVTTDGDLDLTSANGRLVAGILATVAQAEVETKAERRAFSNAAGRKLGMPTSGRVPYGYRWVTPAERARRGDPAAYEPDTGSIETDPARKLAAALRGLDTTDPAKVLPVLGGIRGGERFHDGLTAALDAGSLDLYLAELESVRDADGGRAGDVRRMFDEFLAGVPLGSICRDLTDAGRRTLPTKATPDGAEFRPNTLRRILMSPYYAGLLPVPPEGGWGQHYDVAMIEREHTTEGNWPALVSVEEWQEARSIMGNPKRRTSPGPSRRWLLSGLAVCGVCHEPIRPAVVRRASTRIAARP
ncbi:recombinase family protein [Herbiconiux daphne]|uniref:Recombinase family protein n=1 Tax=Herbiconiux daphne TaxID=2970914 RepID=A0ABT2H6I7_9MICO|nr:recombinase family protein [Herbiconiux daphne]MCS5735514.1 recombinase family protein [Herbiconiux daphne]